MSVIIFNSRLPSVEMLGTVLVVDTLLHRGSNEFGAQANGDGELVTIGKLVVLKSVLDTGGKYVAGSVVGFDEQRGSNEPVVMNSK